ncbi:MAG TPA: ATP-binding protein [Thermomicrobiaceae bacterium]|nr:ATP-binding protein [Thermomicrobiaceae bacterium]
MSRSKAVDHYSALSAEDVEPSNGHEHQHTVQFYGDDGYLIDRLVHYVGSALVRGGASIVFLTERHRQALAAQLRALGTDVSSAANQGRYLALDADTVLAEYVPGGVLDAARFSEFIGQAVTAAQAAAGGTQPRVAAYGELVTLLCQRGQGDVAVALERLWNRLVARHGFDLLCSYPLNCFGRAQDVELLTRVCAEHAHVVPAEGYSGLRDEELRTREIALLQQKAEALAGEVAARQQVQRSLRRRDAELADFLENALEGVLQIGDDETIHWANGAMLRLLGFEPGEFIGQPLSRFQARAGSMDTFWERLRRREEVYDYPAELRGKDGAVRHLRLSANGRWEDDRFLHARCFVRDVTDRLEMEQALLRTNQELRAAVAVRERFLANAAHELKTPITSMRAYAQFLLRDLRRKGEIAPERLGAALEAIESQTGRLTQLATRLVDAVSLDSGRLQVEPVGTDLAALVGQTMAQHYHDDGHHFVFNGPEHLDAPIDSLRFEQVVTNLLNNAVKYSPGGGTVTVELREEGERVRLTVSDQGIGIPLDQRERVFERFHQARPGDHLHGMGIGLYLTREIVSLHGGSVHIEGPEHGGTRVVVTLPRSAPAV